MSLKIHTFTNEIDRERAFSFGAIILCIMIIATGLTGLLYKKNQKFEEDRLVGTIGTILGESISRMSFSGKYHSRLLIEELKTKAPELAYISVEDSDGVIVAHSDKTKNDTSLQDIDLAASRRIIENGIPIAIDKKYDGRAVKEVTLPYKADYGEKETGIVRIGISIDDISRGQKANLYIQLIMILSLTFSSILIMMFLSRYFSKRISESEQALRQSEALARTLMDVPAIAIFMIDRNGICIDTNETLAERLDMPRSEVIGRSIWDLFDSTLKANLKAKLSNIIKDKKALRYEDEGQGIWNDVLIKPLLDIDGEVDRVIVMELDITDRKKAENELIKSTERFSKMAATIPGVLYDYILYPDGTSKFLYLSPRFQEIFGIEVETALNDISSVWSLIHPDDILRFKAEDEYANRHSSEFNSEIRIRIPSGEEKWVHFASKSNHAPPGIPAVWSGVAIDITERKTAEIALEKEKKRIETASKAAKVVLWEWDLTTGKIEWSNYITNMLNGEKAPDSIKSMISLIDPNDRSLVSEKVKKHLKTESVLDTEFRVLKPDGSSIWWQAIGKANSLPDAKAVSASGAMVDISERKLAENEKKRLEEKMLHVQKLESLGVLAGGIAHDFNNILLAILGNAELARMKIQPESPASKHLSEIEKASEKAADLARQMLAYSGRGIFVIQTVDLNKIITDMTGLLEISISKKANLELNLDKNLPPIDADKTQIRQIIMNLVINSSEALGDNNGNISIATGSMKYDTSFFNDSQIVENPREGLYVYLEINDSGCGMNKDTLSKIFDPFFTTKFTGRGLGMAAVSGIVRGHAGAIKIISEPDKGSTTTIFFPASDKKPIPDIEEVKRNKLQPNGKILLVDDEDFVRAVAGEMLNNLGFEVITAEDGFEAVKIFKDSENIKLVILDLTMPNLDGEQTLKEIRSIDPKTKVIISSGYSENEINDRFVSNPPSGFIQKPYRLTALSETIKKIMCSA